LNIKNSGAGLLSIINDIMDISMIETGQVKLLKHRFSINNLISDIYHDYTYKTEENGIEFRLDVPDPATSIFIENDEARIRQILSNFINNSLKFTKKGFIEIGLKKISGGIQIHVKDTGIGIPKESHKIIFERFHQLETTYTRKYCGNGLGLTISKQLADLLGGKIWMESEPGKGSTFYLSLITEQNT
jgi:signal transduction histidine kinase